MIETRESRRGFAQAARRSMWVVLALSVAACAASKGPDVETVWLRSDGTDASLDEVSAARRRCEATAESEVTIGSNRRDYVQWGVRLVECMEKEGLYLVQRERDSD